VYIFCAAVSEELVYLLEERLQLQEQVSCYCYWSSVRFQLFFSVLFGAHVYFATSETNEAGKRHNYDTN